jgi:guanine deaminase
VGCTSDSFLERAIELAIQNVRRGLGGPFAALVVKDGNVIAEGVNVVTASNDPTAHAELVAIRLACRALGHYQLRGCEIYSSCEPCPMCLGAIYWARPDRVYYAASAEDASGAGFDDSFIYRQMALPFGARSIPMVALPTARAAQPFDAWRAKTDKKLY